ncbi:MAG: hypothetical protein AB1635_12035 [Acidobacteriota bacterium]
MAQARPEEMAVLHTIAYAALFDYPLTLEQLRESLIGTAATESELREWLATSPLLRRTIEHRDGFYFPRGRADMVSIRRRREAASRALLDRHRRVLAFIACLPFVRMVALTGSLAHLNADDDADLDLFVITRPGRVWLVTVGALVAAKLTGWRRRLCLNYVISETALAVTPADLFSANQIIHLQPVTGSDAYRAFLRANPFVTEHYPNFRPRPVAAPVAASPIRDRARRAVEAAVDVLVGGLGERACRRAYRWHLRRGASRWQSRDQVRLDDECLKLHTASHRAATMERFLRSVHESLDGEPAPPRLRQAI